MAKRRITKTDERRETLRLAPDLAVPVRIITERGRTNVRASLTQRALHIRLPAALPAGEAAKQVERMRDWARELYRKKPASFARFRSAALSERYRFSLRGDDYDIELREEAGSYHRAELVGEGQILLTVNPEDPTLAQGQLLPKLLAKFFGGRYLPEVARRVHELNDRHFQRPVNAVKLSDTYARWGSCSSRGNINLATRLLLAPAEVLDAVIIHELAHLVEANHSARFWAQVARALPDYRVHDAWLKREGGKLLFRPVPVAD